MNFVPTRMAATAVTFACAVVRYVVGHAAFRRALSALAAGGALTAVTIAAAAAADFDCVMDPSLTLKLGSPVPNILDAVTVDRGDHVKQGQIVARLESAVEAATVALNQARAASTAEIESKEAVLEQKRGVLNRKSSPSILQSSVSAAQDVENARAEFRVAEQDVALAKLNRELADLELHRSQATLDQRTIRSPIDGIVTERALGPGEYVHQEASIITVARIDPLFVEAFLPIRYYGSIKLGDTARVHPDQPIGGELDAKVSVVDQVFDAASGTFGVRLRLPNPDNVVPAGLRCRVTFYVPEMPDQRLGPVAGDTQFRGSH